MQCMKRAALYARVSTEIQKEEGTIQSQIYELQQLIRRDGNSLTKEYVDDGVSGGRLDRPGLDALRADLKANLFDVIYFHNVDRIARDVAYQILIVAEILKHEKQIIINGKDYVHNPENKFTLTVLGAVAELEKAKIIERTARGKRHLVRQGFIPGGAALTPFGYTYVPRAATVPAHYVLNEEEAAVVRYIFETYANTETSLDKLTRTLEEKSVPSQTGRRVWDRSSLHKMLTNTAYYGVQWYYKIRRVPADNQRKGYKSKIVHRDPADWLSVNVPAIVSRELFDRVQARIERNRKTYRNNAKHRYLLSGLICCGLCGKNYLGFCQKRSRGGTIKYPFYRCGHNLKAKVHHKQVRPERCRNKEVKASRLEYEVWHTALREILAPAALKTHVEALRTRTRTRAYERKLASIDENLKENETQKARILDLYADARMDKESYFRKLGSLETEHQRLLQKRADTEAAMPIVHNPQLIRESIDAWCVYQSAQLPGIQDYDSKRQFLSQLISSITFENDLVKISGVIPLLAATAAENRAVSESDAKFCGRSYAACSQRRRGDRVHLRCRRQRTSGWIMELRVGLSQSPRKRDTQRLCYDVPI